MCRQRARVARRPLLLLDLAALFLLEAREGAALVRVRILDDAVDLAALVAFWQVLGNRKTFRITEEQSVAVFVLLHLLAGADPGAPLHLFLLVLVEVAGAERSTEVVHVLGEADHEELGDLALGMEV